MRIFIASDHAGISHKEKIMAVLQENGHEVNDCGDKEYNENDDYPDFVSKVAREIYKDPEGAKGIVIGGSGQGEAMVCNRFPHVRAAVFYAPATIIAGEADIISLSRQDNDANVLSIGARFVSVDDAIEVVMRWLNTPFSNEERHIRRIAKIDTFNA